MLCHLPAWKTYILICISKRQAERMCVLPESYPTVGNEEFVCVCVLIWKEACSYRNSLLGFWRWANIQPIKMKPSGGRWFNVSSNPVSMQFLKNMLQKSNSFWLRLTVSKKITSTHSHPHCVNSCAGDSQLYILTLHTCCWHGTWERVQIAHTWTHSSPI